MKIIFKQFPDNIQDLTQSNNGLRQALNRLEHGSPATPRSWFYEQLDPASIVGTIESKLNGMKDLKFIADWDLSKISKYGPQGESAPLKDRLDTLNEYFEHLSSPKIIEDPIWKKAKAEAIRRLKFNESGSPVTSEAVVKRGVNENKYNTNSGYPLFIRRNTQEAKEEAIHDAPTCISDQYPCVLGSRASMGKIGKDARHIFMASMAVNVNGQRFQQPLQDYVRSLHLDFFSPWEGWEETQDIISQNWDSLSLKFGADYSKMDQHFNSYHGFEVFDVVKHYFKKSFWGELNTIINYVFTVPIITNLGIIQQPHAMPSGSEWTNFLETLWNYIFTIYLELKYSLRFKFKMGIGDDQLYCLIGHWTDRATKWIVDTVISEFDLAGLPGNKEKQEVSTITTGFLQRLVSGSYNGVDDKTKAAGVYSLIRNVTSQVYPEFYHNDKVWSKFLFAQRCIMIAENAKEHPLFVWYVKEFLAKSNDAILEFVRLPKWKLKAISRDALRVANFIPTYNQKSAKRPIWDFDTFKILEQIA